MYMNTPRETTIIMSASHRLINNAAKVLLSLHVNELSSVYRGDRENSQGESRVGVRELREESQRAPWMLQFLTAHTIKDTA